MNKNYLLMAGGVIALIAAIFLYTNRTSQPETQPQGEQAQVASDTGVDEDQSFSGTLKELIALGRSYSCTFLTEDEEGNKTSGRVYVTDSGNKMNGEFAMTMTDGETFDSNVIRDGEYNYVWSSTQEQGFKSKIDLESDILPPADEEAEASQTTFDQDQKLDFDCNPWTVDESKFVPPSNIEFVDYSAQMEAAMEKMEGVDTEAMQKEAMEKMEEAGFDPEAMQKMAQ